MNLKPAAKQAFAFLPILKYQLLYIAFLNQNQLS